jgi:hypothetical protein
MKTVTLSGHVEGESIRLDEPFTLPAGAKLLITILPSESSDTARTDWLTISKKGLARAYADDEPDYPTSSGGNSVQ